MLDCIIIGGGPAGITASIYAARKQLNILVIGNEIGGNVTKTSIVENYTGYEEITGEELAKKFQDHIEQFSFEFKKETVRSIERNGNSFKVNTEAGTTFKTKTIILALGAKPQELGIPGEEEFKNKGVTYCATCDAPLFFGKDVAVIGSGNSAFETVLQLTNIAKKVYLVMRTKEPKGDKILWDKIQKNPKVEIRPEHNLVEIKGTTFVESIIIKNGGDLHTLKVEGIFSNAGYVPNTDLVKGMLDLNEREEIVINKKNETSVPGIFAAGDCTDVPFKQIIVASGEGAKAGISAFAYLSHKDEK